jgi:hypothetical protein
LVLYDKMPMNHKKKWFINDDVGGSLRKYGEIISWLRVMGCFDGSVSKIFQIKTTPGMDILCLKLKL